MARKVLLAVSFLALIWSGCAKKQAVKPSDQSSAQSAAEESKQEPSVRFADWQAATELKNIYFKYDSSELDDAARAQLKQNAAYLSANKDINILVEGHCDERGTVEYNLALGQRRAAIVRNYYKSLGIPLARTGTISYGKESPLDPGHGEAAWSKNRRASTKIRNVK